MGRMPQNVRGHIAPFVLILVVNVLVVMGIVLAVWLCVVVGMIDEDVGLVAIAIFSGITVSVITTVGYDRLKMFFSIDDRFDKFEARIEARMNARFDQQDKKLDTIIALLVEIRDILRKQYGSPDDKKS